jgi:hypothetical protein
MHRGQHADLDSDPAASAHIDPSLLARPAALHHARLAPYAHRNRTPVSSSIVTAWSVISTSRQAAQAGHSVTLIGSI